MPKTVTMDKIVAFCKRRGFVYQSSEIYGGTGSVWDYGPLGVELKKNVKDRWWSSMVRMRDDIEGLDAAILMHPRVWEASGHVATFTDPVELRAAHLDPEPQAVVAGQHPANDAIAPFLGLPEHPHRAFDEAGHAPVRSLVSIRSYAG